VNVPSDGVERAVPMRSDHRARAALPVTPTGLAATPESGQVYLRWNLSSGAMSYNVKRATVRRGPTQRLAVSGGTNCIDATAVKAPPITTRPLLSTQRRKRELCPGQRHPQLHIARGGPPV